MFHNWIIEEIQRTIMVQGYGYGDLMLKWKD